MANPNITTYDAYLNHVAGPMLRIQALNAAMLLMCEHLTPQTCEIYAGRLQNLSTVIDELIETVFASESVFHEKAVQPLTFHVDEKEFAQ